MKELPETEGKPELNKEFMEYILSSSNVGSVFWWEARAHEHEKDFFDNH